MRTTKRTLLFASLFAISSVAGLKSVAASTDCDKWLRQYQQELANAAAVKHVMHHVHHLIHRTQPRPQTAVFRIPPVHRPVAPKLTPAEMLKRFHVLCDVPEEQADVTPAEVTDFIVPPTIAPPPTQIATAVVPPLPGAPITAVTPVTPVSPIVPPPPGGAPLLPISVTPSQPVMPIQPGQPGGPTPIGPGQPAPPVTPITPVAPTPEPGSIVLMLTGLAGIAGSRFRRKHQ